MNDFFYDCANACKKRYKIIFISVALLIAGIGYYSFQKNAFAQKNTAASDQYYFVLKALQENRDDDAERKAQVLVQSFSGTIYEYCSRLVLSKLYFKKEQIDKTVQQLTISAEQKKYPLLAQIAAIRLASVLAATGDIDKGLSYLSGQNFDGLEFLQFKTKGDLLLARGDLKEALAAFETANKNLSNDMQNDILDIKIRDLKSQLTKVSSDEFKTE